VCLTPALTTGCSFEADSPKELSVPESPLLSPGGDCADLTVPQCDAVQAMLDVLDSLAEGEYEYCEEFATSARERFNAGLIRWGGASSSIHAWRVGEQTLITSLGFEDAEDLGVTILHEEIHHLYPHMGHGKFEVLANNRGKPQPA
jgi:hypothetical protein